jgi:hypothetical protein
LCCLTGPGYTLQRLWKEREISIPLAVPQVRRLRVVQHQSHQDRCTRLFNVELTGELFFFFVMLDSSEKSVHVIYLDIEKPCVYSCDNKFVSEKHSIAAQLQCCMRTTLLPGYGQFPKHMANTWIWIWYKSLEKLL